MPAGRRRRRPYPGDGRTAGPRHRGVRALKASATADLTVGGPDPAAHAPRARLVDEVHLYLTPVVVGGASGSSRRRPGRPPAARRAMLRQRDGLPALPHPSRVNGMWLPRRAGTGCSDPPPRLTRPRRAAAEREGLWSRVTSILHADAAAVHSGAGSTDVDAGAVLGVCSGCVAEKVTKAVPPERDVEAEHPRPVQPRGCVEPCVVMGLESGERGPSVRRHVAIGVVGEDRVVPCRLRRAARLVGRHDHHAWHRSDAMMPSGVVPVGSPASAAPRPQPRRPRVPPPPPA